MLWNDPNVACVLDCLLIALNAYFILNCGFLWEKYYFTHRDIRNIYIYETRYCNLYAFSFRTSRSDYGMTDSNTCTKFNVDCRKNKIKCKKIEIGLEYEVVQEHHLYYSVNL